MQKLRVASCQFPVTQDVDRNAEYVGRYMEKPPLQASICCTLRKPVCRAMRVQTLRRLPTLTGSVCAGIPRASAIWQRP